MAKPTHIVDASALIAYFKGEDGHDRFAELLKDEQHVLAMHIVNLCEVYYGYLRSDALEKAEEAWTKANAILAIIQNLDAQFVKRVGRWKVDHNLGLADSFAAVTAEENGCPLVTTDHNDFEEVARTGALQIVWLR
ncbi:MAG: PIN domain-containing protein [Acidobacteriota bacterium]